MFASFQIVFYILLMHFLINVHPISGLKPNKGETCSAAKPVGPPVTDEDGNEPCFKNGLYGQTDVRLIRRDGVAVSHVQTIESENGKTVNLTTLSLQPLLFEIPEFLSDEECDHIVQLAEKKGLKESETRLSKNQVTREGVNKTLTEKQMGIYCKKIKRYDGNEDGKISANEFANYVYYITRKIVRLNDLLTVYRTLIPEGGEVLTYENCTKINRTSFIEFVYQLFNVKHLPYYNIRYSDQAWIRLESRDPVLKLVKQRIAAVAQMSIQQVEESEDLQVVRYLRGGHYHAHYDSTEDERGRDGTCCSKYLDYENRSCHLCRYITILFYLNNVTEGGQTAFPVAQDEDKLTSGNYSTDLSKNCEKANLLVKPVKGKAIFWYNHFVDEESGKMGSMDKLSLHGGCDVVEGEKWAANLWLRAPRAEQIV